MMTWKLSYGKKGKIHTSELIIKKLHTSVKNEIFCSQKQPLCSWGSPSYEFTLISHIPTRTTATITHSDPLPPLFRFREEKPYGTLGLQGMVRKERAQQGNSAHKERKNYTFQLQNLTRHQSSIAKSIHFWVWQYLKNGKYLFFFPLPESGIYEKFVF